MSTERKMTSKEFFASHPVFTLEQARRNIRHAGGGSATGGNLKYHARTGRLTRVARGVFAVVPEGMSAENFRPDPYLVAHSIRPDGIFAFHGALELLGLAHSEWKEVAVYTGAQRRPPLRTKSFSLFFLQDPGPFSRPVDRLFGTRQVECRGVILRVTGPERTLIEGLRRPDQCGGAEEVVISASGAPVLDLDLVLEILKRYDIARVWSAAGWFLERYRDQFHVSDSFLEGIRAKRLNSPAYLKRSMRGGVLIPAWNLIIPGALSPGGNSDEA